MPSNVIDLKTPHELWSNKSFDYPGCIVNACVGDDVMELGTMKCIFVRYVSRGNVYRLYCAKDGSLRFMSIKDITADESTMLDLKEELGNLIDNGRIDLSANQNVEFKIKTVKLKVSS